MTDKHHSHKIVPPRDVREAWGHLSNAARARVFKRLERTLRRISSSG